MKRYTQNEIQLDRAILAILEDSKCGLTTREIVLEMHRRGVAPVGDYTCAAPRLKELYNAGKIEYTTKRLCLLSGRKTAVWLIRKE